MIKRVLLLSSLMLSVPTWAATQPAAESAPVTKASSAATTATTAAQGANALKESDGKDIIARDPKPDTGNAEHDALLVERRQQQRMVLHLRAKRDSELNRLSLGAFGKRFKPEAGKSYRMSYEGLPGNPSVIVNFR